MKSASFSENTNKTEREEVREGFWKFKTTLGASYFFFKFVQVINRSPFM